MNYSKPQVFSGALRLLRIDLGYTVTEKDAESAYLLFQYPAASQGDSERFGSFEIVPTERGVRLLVNLPDLPGYREELLRDRLVSKLTRDYGPQPPMAPKAPAKAPEAAPSEKPEQPQQPTDGDDEAPE